MNKITETLNRFYVAEASSNMNDQQMKKKIIDIIKDILDISILDMNKSLIDNGADSMDSIQIVMAIEEEFGIEVPDETWEDITKPLGKVQEDTPVKKVIKLLIDFIKEYHKKKPSPKQIKGAIHKIVKKLA